MKFYINYIKALLVVIYLLQLCQIKGQSPSNLPRVVPPSPVASAFTIYGDYPVSQNTGVPDIQIPLYNFRCGDIEVPIVLKYHIGSAKPNPYGKDMSNIGYGWVLDAGGIVTRTINGSRDETDGLLSAKFRDDYDQNDFDDYNALREISVGQVDSEYDIFDYSFEKGAGKFLIFKNSSGTYNVSSFPYTPWKWDFSLTGTGSNKYITSVKIMDDKGFNYVFSDKESNQFAYSGWFLSKIRSPNNRTVNFAYNTRNVSIPVTSYYSYRYDVSDYMIGAIQFDQCNPVLPNQPVINQNYSTSAIGYETKTIKEINSETGKVVFTLNNDNSLIQSFTVYDSEDEILKKITFFRSYFSGQSAYYRLDSLWIQDSNNNPVQKYKFEYNSNSVLSSRDVDYWGWYNGVSSSLYVPYTEFDYYYSTYYWNLTYPSVTRNIGDLNRCVDQNKILAQTLSKIFYPTGGSTEFVFEPNQFTGSSPCNDNSLGDGLRIKSIINRDTSFVTSTKTYLYQPGYIPKDRFDSDNYTSVSYTIDASYGYLWDCNNGIRLTFTRNRSFAENLNANILDNSIRYSVVEELFGTELSNTGKNIYYFDYDNSHIYCNYNYDMVTPDNNIMVGTYLNWGNGLLSKLETYKKESSSYTKVQEKNFVYEFFYDSVFHSLRVYKLTDYPYQITIASTTYQAEEVPQAIRDYNFSIPTPPVFGVYDYNIITGGYVSTKTVETSFFPDSASITASSYYDNGPEMYRTSEVISEGTSEEISKFFNYAYDYSDSIYIAMADSNRIDYIIELSEDRNGSVQKTKSVFKNWGNGIFAPEIVQTAQNSSAYENRIKYFSYDEKGNIISVSKANDVVLTYLWGYSKTYPVAEIQNATIAQVNSLSPGISLLEAGNQSERLRISNGLPGASITFYTYKPLIGMTSKTDPTGITTYYEYDDFGRLKTIKDDDGKILKSYEYNYKQ